MKKPNRKKLLFMTLLILFTPFLMLEILISEPSKFWSRLKQSYHQLLFIYSFGNTQK